MDKESKSNLIEILYCKITQEKDRYNAALQNKVQFSKLKQTRQRIKDFEDTLQGLKNKSTSFDTSNK